MFSDITGLVICVKMAASRLSSVEEEMVVLLERMGLGGSKEEREEMAIQQAKFVVEEAARRKEQKREAGAEAGWKRCSCCGKKGSVSMRCTGCCMVYYCSQECQRQDWGEGHRQKCKEVRKEF